VVEVYVYGGLVFGFNTLVYILKKEGLYSHLCDGTETGHGNATIGNETVITCNAQEIIFTEIATVGFVSFYIAIFSGGILLDKFGLWLIRILLSVALTTGGIGLAFAKEFEPLLWLVGAAWGAQGALALLVSLPIANLFPAQRCTILTFLVGCFDSSSSVLVYFQMLYDSGKADLFGTPIIYVLSGLFVLVRTLVLVPHDTIPIELPLDYSICDESVLRRVRTNVVKPVQLAKVEPVEQTSSATQLSTLKKCFGRLDAWTGLFISMSSAIRQSLFVSTFNMWTRFVHDSEETERELTLIFGFMGYAELLLALLPGLLMDVCSRSRHRLVNRTTGVVLGIAISIVIHFVCNMAWGMSGSEKAGVVAIFAYYAFRSFFFGTLQAAIAEIFPPEVFGTMTGLFTISMMPCVMAVPSFFAFTIDSGRDFSFLANVMNVLAAISILHPLAILRLVFIQAKAQPLDGAELDRQRVAD